jgi:putative transcriptional regulator
MPKTEKELIAREATRDIGAELLQAVKQMKAGKAARTTKVEVSVASKARRVVGLSQTQFATVLGVSVRTPFKSGNRGVASRPVPPSAY